MLIKFIGGRKRASRAAAYLLGAVDSAGLPRPGVEVLRGDPRLVARVADGLPFRHKYTSAVISWAPEDAPSDAEISRTLDEFERLAWAGLDPSRRCWSAVLHREAGEGCHVHVLSARVDLGTGKSLNIAPPGWRRTCARRCTTAWRSRWCTARSPTGPGSWRRWRGSGCRCPGRGGTTSPCWIRSAARGSG